MSYTEGREPQDEGREAAEQGATGEPATHPGAQSLQDKAAINAGLSHDKVAGMDLGASPLGTDDEAGGTVAAMEPTAARAPVTQPEGSAARDPNRANAVKPPVPWIWVLLAVLAAAVLAAVLLLGVT